MAQNDRCDLGHKVIVVQIDAEAPEESGCIDGTDYVENAACIIRALTNNRTDSWTLARAIKRNGTTPGTGMQGIRWTNGSVTYDAIWQSSDAGYIPADDGSDSGLFTVDSQYKLLIQEAT